MQIKFVLSLSLGSRWQMEDSTNHPPDTHARKYSRNYLGSYTFALQNVQRQSFFCVHIQLIVPTPYKMLFRPSAEVE
jgi:hypothetical protein